ncbi:MAG TPA: aminotransferase class I/II-fold pyridoxal phosphate-dependent enzyme [Gammaproteobacteria bacterium]|nr:aminotransferase class I/II-fold pyridoxal phosphate-dependent enzyme [Gammaproteobacteria bacterium]
MQNNKVIPLATPCLSGNEERYLVECVRSNFVSSVGPFVNLFEKNLCAQTGFKHAVAVSSGTAALHLALLACGVMKDDLVIMPTYTFIATANAISHCGAKPWFFDISPVDWNLDIDKVRNVIEKETYRDQHGTLRHISTHQRVSALVPVFCMGMPIDFTKAMDLAKEYNFKLVVDAAAGIGSKSNGFAIGEMEMDASIMSFNGNKNITSGGGGCVLTNNIDIANKASHLSTTGKVGVDYDHDCVAFNYRMTNLQAAVGCAQLEQLDKFVQRKREIDQYYRENIKSDFVRFFPRVASRVSSGWLSGLLLSFEDIGSLIETLKSQGVESKFFWKPIHHQKPYCKNLKQNVEFSESLWDKVIVLPSSASLTQVEQNKICGIVNNYFDEKKNYEFI